MHPTVSAKAAPALDRRRFLVLAGGAAAALALRGKAHAAQTLIDPYAGVLPLTFPLAFGTYRMPLADNWHEAREGKRYAWGHRADGLRSHDGVDIYPADAAALPAVYAPFAGVVSAVGLRAANTADASVSYRASTVAPPPWDYSTSVDTVDGLPLYGNFVWITSTAPGSAGYSVLYAHLENEATLAALQPDQWVDATTAVGVMSDTGNAAGTPQLHVELHYPVGASILCRDCAPAARVTSCDPFASLRRATARA